MGRPPSNGSPAFRFTQAEVSEMESILYHHNLGVPSRNDLEAIATKFSNLPDRKGKIVVQAKQIWNWFQNRRYALRSKSNRISTSTKPNDTAVVRQDSTPGKNTPHNAPTHVPVASTPASSLNSGRSTDNYILEFEAKSSRDGAWYDVGNFLSCRNMETDPEVLVRFSGFGKEEDEWADPRNHIRLRSLPCESTECVAILPGDLILCFQEGKDQALYFDAHVLDAQRRRHDVRGCRCRFLVRYDHDHSEEIVPLKKMCRRPEADYRLRQMATGVDDVALDGKQKVKVVVARELETSERKQQKEGGEDVKRDVVLALPLPDVGGGTLEKEEEKDHQPGIHNATGAL